MPAPFSLVLRQGEPKTATLGDRSGQELPLSFLTDKSFCFSNLKRWTQSASCIRVRPLSFLSNGDAGRPPQ